jgi:hypothetical protein
MTSKLFVGRGSRRPSPRRACRPWPNALEERRLLTPANFLENFENDPINRTGPVNPAVYRLYRTNLHRATEPAGRAFWVRVLERGVGETAAARLFPTSREYRRSHPTMRSFVGGLETDVLDGPPKDSGPMTRRLLGLGPGPDERRSHAKPSTPGRPPHGC